MARIHTLPVELICRIFQSLDDKDAQSLRRACKSIDEATFKTFGRRFFRKRGFMITTFSLSILQQISEHDGLKQFVQHIWFNPDCFTFIGAVSEHHVPGSDDGQNWSLDRNLQVLPSHQIAEFYAIKSDHENLLTSENLEKQLGRIISNLANLITIGMRRSESYKPYGWSTIKTSTGLDPRILGSPPSWASSRLSGPTILFAAIINALARSNIEIQRFYTDAIELDNISGRNLGEAAMKIACRGLRYLEINVMECKRTHFHGLSYDLLRDSERPEKLLPSQYGTGLVHLLASMPDLREIGLQIFPDRRQHHLIAPNASNQLSWDLGYPYGAFRQLACGVSLPHLTRVKLEKFATTGAILWHFLEPSSSGLKSLKIRDVRLLSTEEDKEPWKQFFISLARHCGELDYVLFYHLMDSVGVINFAPDETEHSRVLDEGQAEYLIDFVPASHGGHRKFTRYEHIAVEARGKRDVREKLLEITPALREGGDLFSYAMDEGMWHTDTSDEDW